MIVADKLESMSREELLKMLSCTASIANRDESKFSIYCPTSKVMEKFHISRAKLRVLLSGNRGGKTADLCVEAVIRTTGLIPESLKPIYPLEKISIPCYARLIAVDFSNGVEKILKPELFKWLPRELIASKSDELQIYTLYNGSKIEFMSYDQPRNKFGGTSRHFIGFDEIPPPDIIKENQMRVADVGGDIVLAFTPVYDEKDDRGRVTSNAEAISWFYNNIYLKAYRVVDDKKDVFNIEGHPGYECFHHKSLYNTHINLKELEAWANTLSVQDKISRVEGKFVHLMGLVYGDCYDENKSLVEDFKIPNDWPVYVAIDTHLNVVKTPHHVLYLVVDPNNRLIICGELRVSGTIGELAEQMKAYEKEKGFWIFTRLIDPMANTNDPISGSCISAELIRLGISPITSGSKDMITGISRTKDRFKEGILYIFQSCRGLRWELAHYIYAGAKPLDKDDHFCEDLRRLIMRNPCFMDRKTVESLATQEIDWMHY